MRKLRRTGGEDSYDLLTPREREVLQLIAEGKSNKDVANMLHLKRLHGGNTSREYHGETEIEEHSRADSLRGTEGNHLPDPSLLGEFLQRLVCSLACSLRFSRLLLAIPHRRYAKY